MESKFTRFYPSDNHIYRIVSAMNDKIVLDMSQNQEDLNQGIVFEWHDSPNQKFAFRSVGNNQFAIFCAKNNMILIP